MSLANRKNGKNLTIEDPDVTAAEEIDAVPNVRPKPPSHSTSFFTHSSSVENHNTQFGADPGTAGLNARKTRRSEGHVCA